VKCLCYKNRHSQSWAKRTAMQDSPIRNSRWKIFIQWRWHYFCSLTKRYLQWPHRQTPQKPLSCSNQEERRRNKTHAYTINVQSLIASVDDSHKWLRVDQCDTGWWLMRFTIITWCCYNSWCPPYVFTSDLNSSSSFSRSARRTQRLGYQLFTRNFVRCWPILKFFQSRLSGKYVMQQA